MPTPFLICVVLCLIGVTQCCSANRDFDIEKSRILLKVWLSDTEGILRQAHRQQLWNSLQIVPTLIELPAESTTFLLARRALVG